MNTLPNQNPIPTQNPAPVTSQLSGLPVESQPAKKFNIPKGIRITLIILSLPLFLFVYYQFIWPAYFDYTHPGSVVDLLQSSANKDGVHDTSNIGLFDARPELFRQQLTKVPNFKSIKTGRGTIKSLPENIGNITDLESLDVAGNELKQIPPGIGNLANLKILILNDNQIVSLPQEIGNLINLEILDLRDNKITSLPETISNLTNLKRLDLGGNPLAVGQKAQIQSLLPNTQINY